MTTTEINKKFAELAGICWHEFYGESDSRYGYCRHCLKHHSVLDINFDFCADPRLVLREMIRILPAPYDWAQFLYSLNLHGAYVSLLTQFANKYLFDTTGLFALAGIAFMEGKK
jgi:hypothetical protein